MCRMMEMNTSWISTSGQKFLSNSNLKRQLALISPEVNTCTVNYDQFSFSLISFKYNTPV